MCVYSKDMATGKATLLIPKKSIKSHVDKNGDRVYDLPIIYFDDPDFWGGENIIEPTEDLLKGIEKIKRRIARD